MTMTPSHSQDPRGRPGGRPRGRPGFRLTVDGPLARLHLDRPEHANALSPAFWRAFPRTIGELARSAEVRALILSAEGPNFCAGMDLAAFSDAIPEPSSPSARLSFYHLAMTLQETFTVLERLRVPVVAVIQGACLGAGLELAAACDLRIVTHDARFRIEEINVGIMADVGALQRLPKMLPDQVMKSMAFLGETLDAEAAQRAGFVRSIHATVEEARVAAEAAAGRIIEKAPVALAGTKAALNWARDHSVADALEWSARTQSALWSTTDIGATLASRAGRAAGAPDYEPLQPLPDGLTGTREEGPGRSG